MTGDFERIERVVRLIFFSYYTLYLSQSSWSIMRPGDGVAEEGRGGAEGILNFLLSLLSNEYGEWFALER